MTADPPMCDYRTMADQGEWPDIGERIRTARLAARLSQSELAAAIGLDRTMIAKMEAGSRRVDALELARLATALGVPMATFLERGPLVLSHRSMTLTEDTDTEAGRETVTLDIALATWFRELRQLIGIGMLTPRPVMSYPHKVTSAEDARRAAMWLRDELHLADQPIDSMMSLCEQCGQQVLVTSLPGDGASAIDGDLAAAVVSLQGDPGRRRATAAHELGHMLLGDEYSSDLGVNASRESREAVINAFAAELLMPMSAFARHKASGEPITRDQLLRLAATYRTSWSLTVRQARAAGLGPFSPRMVQASPTRAEFLEAIGWTPQPDLDSIRVPPAFANAVMRAWRDGYLTRTRVVELMHGQIEENDLPRDAEGDVAP
ncbi:XRE family transcriptional regulator [Luedemannella helvata]